MADKQEPRSDRFSPGLLYLSLICCLIIAILIVNGYFEINRTRHNLRGILETQGETLLQSLEREIQNTVSVIEVMEGVPGGHLLNIAASAEFFALEDAIVDYLLGIATQVDQEHATLPLSPPELEKVAQREGLTKIDILKVPIQSGAPEKALSPYVPLLEGSRFMVIIPFERMIPEEGDLFSVAVRRTKGDGIIAVSIDAAQMENLRRRFAIQSVLRTMSFGEGIHYLSVFDDSFSVVAQVTIEDVGDTVDVVFLKSVQTAIGSTSRFRVIPNKQEVFEIAKTLRLEDRPYGIVQVGLSTGPIQEVLSPARRSVVLSVAVLVALSLTGVTLIYINQHRHLRKLREVEERAHAAERLLSIGKLGAGLAHEIRNPLNAIAMAIQRLHREFLPQEEERAGEYGRFIGVIREEIKRLNQIVDQFILFSKPYELTLTSVSLAELLDDISILFAEEAQARSVVMEKEIDSQLPAARLDKGKISQALINIVTNGLHAMERGGKLTIKAEIDRKDWARITISDTGKGIPKEEIEKVFDYSYTTREKGLGLGLPIAHKIIEEHGGRITIASRVGKGTAVSILLPIGETQ